MNLTTKTLIVFIGQFAVSMERILVIMILSRTLSRFDYGTYQQVWLLYILVMPMFTLGLPGSILYFIPSEDPIKRKTIVFQTLFLIKAIDIIFSLIMILTAPLVAANFNNPDLVLYIRIFSLYPIFASFSLPNLVMIAEGKPIYSAILSVLSTLVIVTFWTIPSLIDLPLRYTFYSANIGAIIFFCSVLIFLLWFYRGLKFHWDGKLLRNQLSYSIPLGLASVLGVFSLQLNKAVVSTSFPPDMYAVYANGAFEVPFIGLLTGSLMAVLVPEFVRRLKEGEAGNSVWLLWNTATIKIAIILFPVAIFLFIFAPQFIVLMFSQNYLESVPVFRIYLGLAILRVTMYSALLQSLGFTRLILYTSGLGLLLNLGLSLLFIRLFGFLGPAWANVLTTYIWALIYLGMICKIFKIRFNKVMPWKQIGKLMLFALVAGFLTLPISLITIGNTQLLLLGAFFYSSIYLTLLVVFNFLPLKSIFSIFDQLLPIKLINRRYK